MSRAAAPPNPFPGLRPFRSDEHHLFFGREEQTSELLSLLRQHRFLAVVGTSGSGKSSLVQAGLIPALHRGTMARAGSAWEIVVLRPGGRPIENMARALVAADLYDPEDPGTLPRLRATLSRSRFGLAEAVKQSDTVDAETNVLIVVDQFEELFRFRQQGTESEETATAFVNLLLEASAQDDQRIFIALTMRSDYLGDCSNIPGLAEAVNRGEYLIPRLLRDQKREAIEMPVGVGGATIAPRLVQRILNEIGDDPDQLPVLQHALMRTWEVWADRGEPRRAIDFSDFDATGGLAEALSRHANEIFQVLPDSEHRRVCERIFKTLTEKGSDNRGIRRPTRLARLQGICGTERPPVLAVLDAFRRPGVTFLMPGLDRELADETVIDLSHESLMRCWEDLRGWVEEEAQSARIFRRLLDTARLWRDGRAGLFRDPDLQISLSWREQEQPNPEWAEQYGGGFDAASEFLEASRLQAEEEEQKIEAARQHELAQARALAEAESLRVEVQKKAAARLRKLLAAAAAIAVVALGASVFAVRQTRKAETSESVATALARKLKTSLVQGDWDLSYEKLDSGDGAASLAYLARAMRTDPSYAPAGMRAVATLSNGTIPTQRFAPIEHEKPISRFLHNEKHDLLVTESDGGRDVRVWDFETGTQRGTLQASSAGPSLGAPEQPAPETIVARLKQDFAGARNIWLAADPKTPPSSPRYFRKTIELPKNRVPVRADLFILVDDSFDVSVNGTAIGVGENWETAYHHALGAPALASGLDLSITARNVEVSAGLMAAVFVAFAEGEPLIVTSDRSWQSSTDPKTGFADSADLGTRMMARSEELLKPTLTRLQWSSDKDRLLGYASGSRQLVAWDLASLQPAGKSIEVPALRNFQVAPIQGSDDIVGCDSGDDKALQVWNMSTGEPVTPRLKTEGSVSQWQFTPDGRRIVGLFSDSRIGVWETIGGKEIARFDTRPHRVNYFTLSPDGRHVVTQVKEAVAGDGTSLAWWELVPGVSALPSWVTVPFDVHQLRFPGAGGAVAALGRGADDAGRARTFSLPDRAVLADITTDPKAVEMGIHGNAGRSWMSTRIFGAVSGNVVTIWDLQSGAMVQRLAAPELLDSANLSPDGRRVVAGSATQGTSTTAGTSEKKLFVFDLFSGSLAIPRPIMLAGPCPISFSPDAETLVSMDKADGTVRFWDLRTGRQVREPFAADSIQEAIFSRSGKRVALAQMNSMSYSSREFIGQESGRLFVEQVGVPPALPEFLSERGEAWGWVAASSDGPQWMIWSRRQGGVGARLIVRDAFSLDVIRTLDFDFTGVHGSTEVYWSRDGRRMIFINGQKSAALADVASGTIIKNLVHDAGYSAATALSDDGSKMAQAFQDGTVKIWSEQDGELTVKPFAHDDSIKELGFSGDGSLLGVADRSKRTFALIDTRTGALRFPPKSVVTPVDDFAFTPDGRYVIVSSAGTGGKLPMFDTASGELVRGFPMRDWSRGVDLSRDGTLLAAGSGSSLEATNGEAYLFEVATGRMLTPPLSAGGTVVAVAFDPTGAMVATGTFQTESGFGYAQLWDVATGRALSDPVAGRATVVALTFRPDGRALAVGWSDGAVNLLPVPPRGDVPGWLPVLAEAVADRRLAPDTGVIESVEADRLAGLRHGLLSGDRMSGADAPWIPWARWLFEDPQERAVFPGAKTTMALHVARLRTGSDISDLHQAVRWSPSDALTHARLALLYQETIPVNLPPAAKGHWDDSAVWYSDRAIELARDNVDVWSMRADLMRRLKRPEAAAEATARALEIAPADQESRSPNAPYQNALALATDGKWEEAGKAFATALAGLDEYRRQVDAGEQPLPPPGVLAQLVPTRKSARTRPPAAGGAGSPGVSDTPIPGAFEDFEGVVDGSLPKGWRVRNRSDRGARPGVHHLGDLESDLWMDWVVLGREKVEALTLPDLTTKVLQEGDGPAPNGAPPSRLAGRFALALSQGRSGNQVQFLESPDYDCTGQSTVFLSFHSAFDQSDRAMAVVEYSVDRGESWLPVRYFVPQVNVDQARSTVSGGKLDLNKLLDTPRDSLPIWVGKDGRLEGGKGAAFVTARRDMSGLADCFEGREPTYAANATEFKRIETFPLPQAAGKAAVRLRFGLAGSNARYWGLDSIGLHAGAPAPSPDPSATAEAPLDRPSTDAAKLAKAGLEQVFGPGSDSPDYWAKLAGQIVAPPQPEPAAAGAPGASTTPTQTKPGAGANPIVARLLMDQALQQEGRTDPFVRASAAAVRLRSKDIEAAWKILTTSDDLARDLVHSSWRTAMGLAAFVRGATAAAPLTPEDTRVLFSMADEMLEGNSGARQSVRAAIAKLEHSDGTKNSADSLLLKRESEWSYHDEGHLPATDWNQPDFDSRRWFRGRAPLGYGGDGETTTVQYGPESLNKFTTTYFRTSFEIKDPRTIESLALRVRRDDGVVIYFNGIEVARDSMPPGLIDFNTPATTTAEDPIERNYISLTVDAPPLRQGTNWVAAEVHQVNATSSDLGFDLEAEASSSSARRTAASPTSAAVFAARLEALGIPGTMLQHLLRKLVEYREGGALSEGMAVVLASSRNAPSASKTAAVEGLWLQALQAEGAGDTEAADRLGAEALEALFKLVDAAEAFECRTLPVTLREAALLVRRGPADRGFLYRRIVAQKAPAAEAALVLRWARAAAGNDPVALKEIGRGLLESTLYAEALTLADSVLASGTPAPDAPPVAVRLHKEWLQLKEKALAGLDRRDDANAVKTALGAAPPRPPGLAAKLLDLTSFYNSSLYDGRSWEKESFHLSALPETYPQSAAAPPFDLRGLIQLRGASERFGSRTLPDRIVEMTIGAATPVVHFLLGVADAGGVTGRRAEVGTLVLHYADDSAESIPLVTQVNITDFWRQPIQSLDSAQIAWIGRNTQGDSRQFQLAHFAWKNPHPQKVITSFDFVSAKAGGAPFLVAVTVE